MRHAAVCLWLALIAAPTSAQDVELRPIDRATVRVVGVRGIDIVSGSGNSTGLRRVAADPLLGHGSGVAIGPRLVLTARHVVWGMNAWAVIPPGRSQPIAAHPIYVDIDQDIAFVQTDEDLPEYVSLPEVRALRMSETVSVSGYPLDLREPNPAAVSGEVSRVTRDGLLHLAMAVNPGNSGGPVIDTDGNIIGIISARGRPEAGIAGLAIAVPLRLILEARTHIPDRPVSFPAYAQDLARAIELLASLTTTTLPDARISIAALLSRIEGRTRMRPEHRIIFAALAWNTVIAVMERQDVAHARRQVAPLYRVAVRMARAALEEAPHLRRRFPAIRLIALARTAPFSPTRARRR